MCADGEVIDTALGVFMYAPHSYTGEDAVEFHCHGSPLLLRSVVARCCEAGARLAAPGEFTKRAFLNGRLDLVQAEAVAEVVSARTETAARVGVRHLSGRPSGAPAELREKLLAVKARAELRIDFPEEDEETEPAPAELVSLLSDVAARIDALLGSFRFGRLDRDGCHVANVGRPCVGNS